MAAQDRPGGGGSSARPAGSTSVRRPSRAVYRRRQILALFLAVVLLGGLTAGGFAAASMISSALAADNSEPGSTATETAATDGAGAEALAPNERGADAGCDENAVIVSASTDQRIYTAEKNPLLTLQVENAGKTDCVVNLGTSQMEFVITSGTDRIFSSMDCQVEAEDKYQTLKPGQSEVANFQWKRNRTAPGCDPVEVKPKPGVYVLVTKLGERASNKAVFELN